MYSNYESQGLQILGFPCNQFGGQEPGTAQDISNFANGKYGVTFPMFEKIDVNGKSTHPVYNFLRSNSSLFDPKKKTSKEIPWNFAKFLVDANGQVIKYYEPKVFPEEILDDIRSQL